MRLLHLHRPHLPLELARTRAFEPFPPGPLVLGGRPWDPGQVVDANKEARALGVRRGMPLGSAHRLVPEATFIDPDPDADRAIVEAAFEALAAFSPGIAGSADPTDGAFGLFEVQVDGLEALWGPEPVLVGRLVEALEVDAEACLILAKKIPARIHRRVQEWPDVFGRLAELDDTTLDWLWEWLGRSSATGGRHQRLASEHEGKR
jgi:hypothetical protein